MSRLDTIHGVLDTHGKLGSAAATIPADADLFAHGMTSHASVNVMLALEDAFEIEFPDELLTKATFGTIEAIAAAVDTLLPVAV
ncbi:MAG: acyl carrier protein [Rhodoglobus sp.]